MAKKRKKAAKRELINTGRDKRYVRRGGKGVSRRAPTWAARSPQTAAARPRPGLSQVRAIRATCCDGKNNYNNFISCERTTSSFCLKRVWSLWR
jgi:hypothetical protein